ncbi:MAG: ribosomal-protein-alanine N-acetyltransferase [Nitrospirae bacterium]|nr:MAG: ribosomal-protein-alanine N-acetyltransferase [Nitrospirota bacterium]
MSWKINIRPMRGEDLDGVFWIERDSFSIPWSKEAIKRELENPHCICLVAEVNGRLAGFIMGRYVVDEAEVLEFAVKEEFRRKGVGLGLLSALKEKLRKRNIKVLYLEVRQSNTPAIRLYQKAGFKEWGRRRDYYFEPREDALLMKLPLEEL